MSGSWKKAPIVLGSYVEYGPEDDKKNGLVVGVGDSTYSIRENGQKSSTNVEKVNVRMSRSAAFGNKFMDNIRETAENVVINGVALRVFYKRDFFGHQSIAFLCSDALYELLLKDLITPIADWMAIPVSSGKQTFFDSNDFIDLIRKLPFTFLGQCLFQKVMQKKRFFAHVWENLISQSLAIYGTNLLDRFVLFDSDEGAKNYYYP